MNETREQMIARLESIGQLDPHCLGCVEQYAAAPNRVYGPSHRPSTRCESGQRSHCTCDVCF